MWTPAPLIPAVLALTLASPAFAVWRSRVLARNCGDRGRARSRTLAHYWRFGSCGSGSASEAAGRRPSGRRRREGGRPVDANRSSFRRPRCALRALGAARERVHVTYQRHRDRRAAAPAAPGGGRRPGRPRLQVSNVCGRSTPMPSSKPVIHRDLPAFPRLHSAWRGVRFNKPASVTANGSRR